MRTLTAAVETAIVADNVIQIDLVQMEFTSGAVRVHNGVGNITYAGNVYSGIGKLGQIDEDAEGQEMKATGARFSLSGVPNDVISIALNENYQGKIVTHWIGLLDEQHRLIADPVIRFKGRMDTMAIEVGQTSSVTVTAEDLMADWDRPRVRRYNDSDQKAEYAGDRGMEFVAEMVDKTFFWGKVVSGYG